MFRAEMFTAKDLCVIVLFAATVHCVCGCPNGCDCSEEGTNLKCRIPWARHIPVKYFPAKTKKLDLSDNNILNIQPESLSALPNLEELTLNGNKIYFLENKAFKGSPHLRKISLEDNNIHFIGENVFEDLKELEELSLSKNEISKFPKLSINENLKSLCLASNQISRLESGALSANIKLETLNIKRNQIRQLARDVFPANVSSYTNLNLVGNSLKFTPSVIKEMTNLESLSLCFNPIKVFAAEDFADLTNLKNLSMTDVGLEEFPANVFTLEKLERLWIGHNKITGESLENMRYPNLVELDLNNNEIGSLPRESFREVRNLTNLDLSHSKISRNEERAFSPLTKLQSLNLCDNMLEYMPVLTKNEALEILNLDRNRIGSNLDLVFTSSLTNLRELRLSHNDLTTFEPKHDMSSVKLLDLSHNLLTEVSEDFKTNMNGLKTLNVSNNAFVDLESEDFSVAFPVLETLNLRGNNLTSIPQFTNSTKIRELNLCHNRLQNISTDALLGLPNLEVITANDNQIMEIQSDTFQQNTYLKRISLNRNKIKRISTEAFTNLPELKELWLLFNSLSAPPNIKQNHELQVIGLCNNPIGNLPHHALAGPDGLEVVLLRSMGITELPADVFGATHRLRVLNLALENSLTTIPAAIRKMPQLRVLKLNGNPIKNASATEFNGLNNLREIRLNDMELEKLDVTALFPQLPALRILYLAENPWRCDCEMQWYALGIDGARARIETEDREEMVCASPKRLEGKRFDFLRLGDFRHCLPAEVSKVESTGAVISLPFIASYATDYEEAFHSISYVPNSGGSVKVIRIGNHAHEAHLHGLTPETDYFVCTSIVTGNSSNVHKEKENCFKLKTSKQREDSGKERKPDVGMFGGTTHQDLLILYIVLGASIGFVMFSTLIAFVVWCRRTELREHFANLSEISDGPHERSNGEFGAQSTPKKPDNADFNSGLVGTPSDANGRPLMMQRRSNAGHVNEACDVMTDVPKTARTKL